jgi:hypothetical protein
MMCEDDDETGSAVEIDQLARYKTALERIRDLPKQYGHFDGHHVATAALQIAKEALSE